MMKKNIIAASLAALFAAAAQAGTFTGPSTSTTPYVIPTDSSIDITSILTTGDAVGGYRMAGIPDGLGAYDNGDGTFTVLMNHELGNTLGITRAHGAKGAFVSEWVINKSDLSVVSGRDLIQNVYGWNATTQSSNAFTTTTAFNRMCSADLAPASAFYNAATGMGTTARLYLNGEEGGATGYALANVATGANKGNTYILGKFNTGTNGSGGTAVGGWENLLANPYAQNKTVVIGNNDGGTGIMANALAVYVGTKTNTGTDADKAGLTNGVTKFVNVTGVTQEITAANATTRNTAITSGTRFTLNDTASTTFSRPEDGAWNPNNAKEYYFVTTDQLDKTNLTGQTQKGATRLWRLTFDDITNPDGGGKIDLLVDGGAFPGGVGNDKPNMFDNMTVLKDGTLILNEDVGGNAHNGKMWHYDPVTGSLKIITKSDAARFGDIVGGSFVAGTLTNDEETSGTIDITDVLGRNDGKQYALFVMQNHAAATGANATELVEGGQLLIAAVPEPSTYAMMGAGLGLLGFMARRRKASQ